MRRPGKAMVQFTIQERMSVESPEPMKASTCEGGVCHSISHNRDRSSLRQGGLLHEPQATVF